MMTFSVPASGGFTGFSVEIRTILFAGSRHGGVSPQTAHDLVSIFGSFCFSFLTGCAKGIDESFRLAFERSQYRNRSLIACAFKAKAETIRGVLPLYVVPDGLPPKVALAKRTLWMTSRCSLLVLFPSSPIGRGSALAFQSAIMNSKPVFVVTNEKPKESPLYTVLPSNLFGIVSGFWCIPPVYQDTGLCYESV
jgi:hypothetical protein